MTDSNLIVAKWASWCVCGRLILGGDKCHQVAKGSQARHPECISLPPRPSRRKPLAVDVAQEEALRAKSERKAP